MKTTLFYSPLYYKIIWWNGKMNKKYWKEIATNFIKQKYNSDTSWQGFPIEMYLDGLPHKLFFIALTLQKGIVIGPMKKLVASYIIRDLVFLD